MHHIYSKKTFDIHKISALCKIHAARGNVVKHEEEWKNLCNQTDSPIFSIYYSKCTVKGSSRNKTLGSLVLLQDINK